MRFLFPLVLLLLPVAAQEPVKPEPDVETVHSDAPYYVETVKVDSNWIARGTRPQDYRMGIGTTAGSLGPEAFVIRAKPGVTSSLAEYGTMMQMHKPGPFLGKRLKLTARMKSEGVQRVQMWLRVDGKRGPGAPLSFYNMRDRPVRGTSDWKTYEIVLDVPEESVAVAYGFFVGGGRGTAWMDGLTLETVGNNVPITLAAICNNGSCHGP
jgi:hypothetical protein